MRSWSRMRESGKSDNEKEALAVPVAATPIDACGVLRRPGRNRGCQAWISYVSAGSDILFHDAPRRSDELRGKDGVHGHDVSPGILIVAIA